MALPETDSGTDSFSWQLGLDSESDSMQCENFSIVQCNHWVLHPNPSLNTSPNPRC